MAHPYHHSLSSVKNWGGEVTDFRALAHAELTLVILMGVEHRSTIAAQLIEGGLDPATPVAVVEQAWTGQQRNLQSCKTQLH